MSSRLLQMKFMQRAAASSQPSSPRTPGSTTANVPSLVSTDTHSDRPNKRPRLSTDIADSPLSRQQSHDSFVDLGEERRREEALEWAARERGETRWHLKAANGIDTPGSSAASPLPTASNQSTAQRFVEITRDEIDDSTWAAGSTGRVAGRLSFGRKPTNTAVEAFNADVGAGGQGSDDDSSGTSDVDESNDGRGVEDGEGYQPRDVDGLAHDAAQRARVEWKSKRSAERARSADMARERRRKEVRLNGPSSGGRGRGGSAGISSGGSTPNGRRSFGGGGGNSSAGRYDRKRSSGGYGR